MKTAIAITLFRREKYTKQVLDALLKCYGIEDIPVYLSQDWASQHQVECEAVKALALDFQTRHKGKSQYFVNDPRLGIDLNKLSVVPKAFAGGADFVILVEDDTIMSRDWLQYFIAMGEKYRDDATVLSVTGYNRITDEAVYVQIRAAETYTVHKRRDFCPWTWGMWKDRWDKFYSNDGEQYKRETGGGNGKFDAWANLRAMQCVYPALPRANHIGGDNAEHTPNMQWLMDHEFSPFGAFNEEMPSAQDVTWVEKTGTEIWPEGWNG